MATSMLIAYLVALYQDSHVSLTRLLRTSGSLHPFSHHDVPLHCSYNHAISSFMHYRFALAVGRADTLFVRLPVLQVVAVC